ncbi:MAG: biotin--[acetyl-CoA-carboxylase] ligase [Pseudomonadota bacterium]
MTAPVSVVRLPDGYDLFCLDVVDNTNEEAKRLADKGTGNGALVWARQQQSGRGRRGRVWSSPAGNLYCSLLLRPERPLNESARLTFLAAIAMAEAIDQVTANRVQPACKWPNDLLVHGRKLSGILLESASSRGTDTDYLVIGTGVNVAFHPEDSESPATSLASLGAPVSVRDLVEAYMARMAHWLDIWQQQGFVPIRAAWLARAHGLGEAVTARLSDRTQEGTFVGLDDNGALLLRDNTGQDHFIGAGEIFFRS